MACAQDLEFPGSGSDHCYHCHRFDQVKRPSLLFWEIYGVDRLDLNEGMASLKPSEAFTCDYCGQSVADQCYQVIYLSSEDNDENIHLGYICACHVQEPDIQKVLFERYLARVKELAIIPLEFRDINDDPVTYEPDVAKPSDEHQPQEP